MAAEDKRTARQQAAAERVEKEAADRRKWELEIGVVVIAVIAVIVVVGIIVQHNKTARNAALGTGPFHAPAGAVGTGGLGIPFGSNSAATVTLLIYEDYRCPFCKKAEGIFEPVYRQSAQQGKIKVEYHPVNLIDRSLGGTGSISAANAAACAQDAGKYLPYHDLLFQNQPDENNDAYESNATLINLARRVPGLVSAAFASCVNHAIIHGSWVSRNYQSLVAVTKGSPATPYYAINGKQYQLTNQPIATQRTAFSTALNNAIAGRRPRQVTVLSQNHAFPRISREIRPVRPGEQIG
jgi:protein-disulfide isomerase